MLNSYKNRVIFFLFGIVLVTNAVLLSLVFFAYSSVLKKDYTDKLNVVARQSAVNANLILSVIEEETEVFINKHNVEEELDGFKLEAVNFVRADNTIFEVLTIFKDDSIVYTGNAEFVDYYTEPGFCRKISDITTKKKSGWFIHQNPEKPLDFPGSLFYVRTLFEQDGKTSKGCVLATVSQNQLARLLNLYTDFSEETRFNFLPRSIGICIGDKIFFPSENNARNITEKENGAELSKNEECFKNSLGDKEFYTVHSTKNLKSKLFVVLTMFIVLFVIITLLSYLILRFVVNKTCSRINNLNKKIESYSLFDEVRENEY